MARFADPATLLAESVRATPHLLEQRPQTIRERDVLRQRRRCARTGLDRMLSFDPFVRRTRRAAKSQAGASPAKQRQPHRRRDGDTFHLLKFLLLRVPLRLTP